MRQPCGDPIDTPPRTLFIRRCSGRARRKKSGCIDSFLDHLVYLIMCNIQEPRNKAVATAYKSLITCSQTHAFNTFNFLPVTPSLTAPPLFVTFQPDTPLLLLPPLVFRPFFFFFFNVLCSLPSCSRVSRRECRRATPAISTNHCDLSCTPGVTVMAPACVGPRLCEERHAELQRSRNKPTSITNN